MSRSVLVNPALTGLGPRPARVRPVAAGPFAILSFAVALLPIRQPAAWAAAVLACNAVPWLLGVWPRRRGVWTLSEAGLRRLSPDGSVRESYERDRIEEFAVTSEDGALTVFHKFGMVTLGPLADMGFDVLGFYMTARRLGITTHVVDGDRTVFDDSRLDRGDVPGEEEAPRALGRRAEQRLRDLEAALLAVTHEPRTARETRPARLTVTGSGRSRSALLGVLLALVAAILIVRIGMGDLHGIGDRVLGGLLGVAGAVAFLGAYRRRLATSPLVWTITPDELQVGQATAGQWQIPATDVAALAVGPGIAPDPVSGRPRAVQQVVTVFGHRLEVLAWLPARGLDPFQLTHILDERGYAVVTPDQGRPRPSEYGLSGLPDIFSRVPGGRLVVDDDGIGWADGAGDVVLRMPRDRIGGLELLTVNGHAWLRMYDEDGDEFLAAPLAMLRISRTDLREAARKARLPIIDAEYDAYVSATFHGSVTEFAPAAVPAADPPPERAPLPPTMLDVPGRTRALAYAVTTTLCEVVAVLGSLWLRREVGGFWTALAWAAPAGMVLGVLGAWLYDRNRPQLRISGSGVSSVTRLGRTEWNITRAALGGVGIDEADEPRLVVWSPAGRILRRVSFPPDLTQLRRACEKHGLPWGPPDTGHAAPPPEL